MSEKPTATISSKGNSIVPGRITVVDDEDLACDNAHFAPVVNLAEYRARKIYHEFWSDPCWTKPTKVGIK